MNKRKELEAKIIALNGELAIVSKELAQLSAENTAEAKGIISEMEKLIAHLEDLGFHFIVECYEPEFGTYEWMSPRSISFE